MEDRAPLIDQQTFEVLHEVWKIIDDADRTDKRLNPTDVSYMNGLLKSVLMLNSQQVDGVTKAPTFMDRAKGIAERLKP